MSLQLPWQRVHFTGVGGVGMTGLALILRDAGVAVSGTDAAESKNLELLRARGATVHLGHAAAHVDAPDLLVYSSAVPPENPERRVARAAGIPERRRGLFLADLAAYFPQVVSVAGSHGKTTTSAMLSHILIAAGRDPGFMVGARVDGRDTPAAAGNGQLLVTEVDESDATQAAIRSSLGIVLNAEDDHSWSVGGIEALRQCFRDFAAGAGTLLAYDLPETRELFADHPNVEWLAAADVREDLDLVVPGHHNRVNASIAVRAATWLGVPEAVAAEAIRGFTGVDRRLSVRYQGPTVTVIEDYAHHPTEVRESLRALRERFPGRSLRVVFQPHRYERIAHYGADFGRELGAADEVVVTPTFSAWVNDADRADPRQVAAAISACPASYRDEPWDQLAGLLAETTRERDLWVIMGAGTVTQLVGELIAALRTRGY